MVYKLRTLDLKLDFAQRTYKLGDTIDVTLDVQLHTDVNVREGRVELVCDQNWAKLATTFIPDTYATATPAGGVISGKTGQITQDRKESFVHSSVRFLDAGSLSPNAASTHTARLRIEPTPPPRLADAMALDRDANSAWTFKWKLVATVDVVRGRNPRRQRAVTITLPELETKPGESARPRRSNPKRATGPSQRP